MKLIKKINSNQFFLSLILTLWSLGQLQRIQYNHLIAFYLHDLALISWMIYFILFKTQLFFHFALRVIYKYKSELFIFVSLVLLGWFSNISSWNQLLVPLLYLVRIIIYLSFGFLTYFSIQDKSLNKDFLLFLMIVISLTILTLGFSQYLFFPDMRFLAIFGWDDHYYRLIYPFFDPAFTGQVLVIFLLAWLTKPLSTEPFSKIFQILLITAIALTFSRSSYFALSFGLLLLIFFSFDKKRLLTRIGLLSLAFMIALVFAIKPGGEGVNLTRTSTIEARISNINQNIDNNNLAQKIIGNGLFLTDDSSDKQGLYIEHNRLPDNFILMMINQMGWMGLLFFLTVGYKSLTKFYHSSRLLWTISLTILLHSLFNATLIQPFVLMFWSFLVGWILATQKKAKV